VVLSRIVPPARGDEFIESALKSRLPALAFYEIIQPQVSLAAHTSQREKIYG
jgi:hypothetical protein